MAALRAFYCKHETSIRQLRCTDNHYRSIDEEVKDIGEKRDRGRMMRIIEANQDTGDVIQRYRRIESLFRQLQVSNQPFTFPPVF